MTQVGAWRDKGMGTPLTGEHCSPHLVQLAASLGDAKGQHRGELRLSSDTGALSMRPVHIVPGMLMVLVDRGSCKGPG